MNDLLLEAYKEFSFENYLNSLKLLNECSNNDINVLLLKALNHLKLGYFKEALSDIEQVEANSNEEKFETYYIKGQAHFNLEMYLEAEDCFKKALLISQTDDQRQKLVKWSNKARLEIANHGLKREEKPKIIENKEPSINNTTTETNVDITKITEQAENISQTPQLIKFINNWYQTPTHVILNLQTALPLKKDQIEVKILERQVDIYVNDELTHNVPLSNRILPENCSFEIKTTRIELNLKKAVNDFNWITLEDNLVKPSVMNVPAYPTSSLKKTNFDEIDKILEKEEKDEKSSGDDGMMRLFRQIYERGDENTRKAMMKSFQTSGGTVLSTNWDEVKEKDYEGRDRPEPPKGQEWKKPEL